MFCSYGGRCGGCPLIEADYSKQLSMKRDHFLSLWSQTGQSSKNIGDFQSAGSMGLRDRADLTWHIQDGKARLGLYDLHRQEILDLEACPMMSESLAKFYVDLRNIKIPVELGSLRLRVGPGGERGIWLDFSNLNVKSLLDEEDCLRDLMELAHVEIGQRRKVLGEKEGRLKLVDPEPKNWFETYGGKDLNPIGLYCSIADFTQPSMKTNRLLVSELRRLLGDARLGRLFEFGSGIGNFTLALARDCEGLEVFERDKYSLSSLRFNISQAGLDDQVVVHSGDYRRLGKKQPPSFENANTILVDPSRSGLGGFLEPMREIQKVRRPEQFIYISCFAESFCEDVKVLGELGYNLENLSFVDQFPNSHHYEVLSYFRQV